MKRAQVTTILGWLLAMGAWGSIPALAADPALAPAAHMATSPTTHSAHNPSGAISCGQCHGGSTWTALSPTVATTTTTPPGFEHNRDTTFALTGAHQKVQCAACHYGPPLMGQTPECRDCHAREHRTLTDSRCERCHTTGNWRIVAQSEAHAEAQFPLLGAHRSVACDSCHARGLAREPASTPSRCSACHGKDPLNPAIHPNHVRAGFVRDCEDCHLETGWAPARIQHDRFWPLEGRHRRADCADCHAGNRYQNTPKACVACHRTDYDQATNPNHKAQRFSTKCETCHTSASSWSSIDPQFHEPYFPIAAGHHAGVACASCHPTSTAQFTCTNCHAHSRSAMDSEHAGLSRYRYESSGCYQCHPTGGGDD